MLRLTCGALFVQGLVLLTLQPWSASCSKACTPDVEGEVPGSELCEEWPQDEVGLVQMHTHINSKKDSSRQPATDLAKSGARAHQRTINDWISEIGKHYTVVVMGIVRRIPGYRGIHSFPEASEIPITDVGEGAPLNPCVLLVSTVLVLGLVMWFLLTKDVVSSGKKSPDGAGAGPLEVRWWHILVLMQMDSITPFSEAAYAPCMPVMVKDFGTTESMVGLSLQVNWVTSGLFAIALGIASDRYGRRPVLLSAMACYTFGALLCAVSPNVECLILARCLMGIGSVEPISCAVLRDVLQDEEERAGLMSIFMVTSTASIALSPLVGGLIAVLVGWRMIFIALSAWGVLSFWGILSLLPETCPALENQDGAAAESEGGVFQPIVEVCHKSLKPLGLMFSIVIMIGWLMVMGSSLPFTLSDTYGASTTTLSLVSGSQALGGFVGSLLGIALLKRFSCWQLCRGCMVALLVLGEIILGWGLFQFTPPLVVLVSIPVLVILFICIHMGPLYSMALEPYGEAAGTINGLVMGTSQPLGAVLGFGMTSIQEKYHVVGYMITVGIVANIYQACFWGLVGPNGEDDPVFQKATDDTETDTGKDGKDGKKIPHKEIPHDEDTKAPHQAK